MSWFTGPYGPILKAALVLFLFTSVYVAGIAKGARAERNACEAAKVAELKKYQAEYQKAVERGDVIAKKLSALESESNERSKEASRNVPKVTSGKSCLNSAAVRMLNHRGGDAVSETTGKPATESTPDAPATDADAAYWIADAISRYEIAAARLNALVDYFEKSQ